MQEEQNCGNCQQRFTPSNVARINPTCGHNICTHCVKMYISTKCKLLKCMVCSSLTPISSDSLEDFPKNITIIKKVKEQSSSISLSSKKKNSDTEIYSNQILINESRHGLEINECSEHGKPLEIICIVDKQLLCPHCAIFGQHRDHKFKTIQEFTKQLEQKEKLLAKVAEKKQIVDKKIRGEEFEQMIFTKLKKKRESLVAEVKDKFCQLHSALEQAEEKIYKDIEKANERVQLQFARLTKDESEIQKMYQSWKEKSQTFLSDIEKQKNLLEKISIFYNPKKGNFTEGELYLKEIQEKNNGVMSTVAAMIEEIGLQFSPSTYNYISSYARVIQSPFNLTTKSVTIIPRQKTPQTVQKVEKKRPIKVEFVKSDEINAMQSSGPSGGTFDRHEKSEKRSHLNSPPLTKQRLSIQEKIPQKKNQVPSQKKITPVKPTRKFDSVTPQKYKDPFSFTERNLNDFKKSTGTLDLTGYDLHDEDISQMIERASEIKKIKCLKLSRNKLTSEGLSQIIRNLSSSTNLNLSFNLLTDQALEEFIRSREQLPQLRVINLSHNKINQRKVKSKIEELKRMGVIVTV